MKSLVPGNYPQVQKDLEAFPPSVLDLLDSYGIKVAVLDEGETLAQSPALRYLSESEYQAERQTARELTLKALSDGQGEDLLSLAESTTRTLRKAGLDFHFGVSSRQVPLVEIAAQQKIPQEHFEHWAACFKDLNEGLPPGLFILPHTYDAGKVIPENRLRSARETTAEYVEGSLGLHRSEDRLVLLHKKFTEAKAEEVGNYRLVLHEMGHALDHVLDRMTGMPGFGILHGQTVDALYEKDQKRAETESVASVFTTERASENVREYFAEAVEAYLTFPKDDDGEIFRAENSKPGLLAKNPELHNYVGGILATDFSASAVPAPPGRPVLPSFVPDPDAEVFQF